MNFRNLPPRFVPIEVMQIMPRMLRSGYTFLQDGYEQLHTGIEMIRYNRVDLQTSQFILDHMRPVMSVFYSLIVTDPPKHAKDFNENQNHLYSQYLQALDNLRWFLRGIGGGESDDEERERMRGIFFE